MGEEGGVPRRFCLNGQGHTLTCRPPLPKTLEQLIQKGMEVQDGLEPAAEPTGPHPPAEEEAESLTPALTNESVASDRTQPE